MLGACFPKYTANTAAHQRSALPANASATSKGRDLAVLPPASPRVSCHSSWWAAFKQEGFKGLIHWIARTRHDRGLSREDRASKPNELGLTIRCMLQTGDITSPRWAGEVKAKLDDAGWCGVDVDKVINDAFSQMDSARFKAVETACRSGKLSSQIRERCDKRQAASLALKKPLTYAMEQSMALSAAGFELSDKTQKALWEETDNFFNSSFGCNREASVAEIISGATLNMLLPLAKNHHDGQSKDSDVLDEFCKQAFASIKIFKRIPWQSLSDGELSMFAELVKQDDLKRFAKEYAVEMKKREDVADRHMVSLHFEARFSELAGGLKPGQETTPRASLRLPCPKLDDKNIKAIVASLLARAHPETVLKVAKSVSDSSKDKLLINAAKKQMDTPVVQFLEHADLIAYLNLPENALSSSARDLLEAEAKDRAEKAGTDGMVILEYGVKSGSYRKLVGAIMEFTKLGKMKVDLQEAAGIDVVPGSEKMPKFFAELDSEKRLELQHLALELGNQGQRDIASRLGSFITRLGRQEYLTPSTREKQAIQEAVSSFFPKHGAVHPLLIMSAVNEELKEKYLSGLIKSHCDKDIVRQAQVDDEMLPVSIQFMKDQRIRYVRIANTPIDGHSVLNESSAIVRRTREFVKEMRTREFTEAQIMMASRIACQHSSSFLATLILNEKKYGLTDAERTQGGDDAKKMGNVGLLPKGLDIEANIVRNPDGNMTVKLEIFNENIEYWTSILPGDLIKTDPLQSSFMSKMIFVIDTKGEILVDETTFEVAYQREILDYRAEP